MHIALHVEYPLLLSSLMKHEFFRQISEKYPNIKFHENPSNGSRVISCGQTEGQTIFAILRKRLKSIIFVFAVQNLCYYYSKVKFALILPFKQNYISVILFYISVIVFPDSPPHIICRKHTIYFLDTFVCTSHPLSNKPRSYLNCGQ